MYHITKKAAMKKMRAKINEDTEPRFKLFMDIQDLVRGLNRKFKVSRTTMHYPLGKEVLNRNDWFVVERLLLFHNNKRNKRKEP